MLAKKFRLQIQDWSKKKNDKIITKKGNFFTAKIKTSGLKFSRFGIIASAKNIKTAVKRNNLKRRIFDFIQFNKLNKVPGKDVLLIALASAGALQKEELEKELYELLV